MKCLRQLALLLLLVAVLSPHVPGASAKPKLVVVVVFDQLPEWALELYLPILPDEGGIKRLIREGFWYRDAWFPQAATLTAVGHSVLSTGEEPRHSGILGNSWYDRLTDRQVYCVEDEEFGLVGGSGRGASPRRLRVPTLGDLLRVATSGQAKVLAIAGKDRAAVLTAGRAGEAFWYSTENGRFVTSRFYRADGTLPPWLVRFNEEKPISRFAGKSWELSLDASAYVQPLDETPGEPEGAKFPYRFPGADSLRALASAVYASPFLNVYVLECAAAAVEGEQLGRDSVPDLLWIGLSATDAVGHRYGPMSLEYQDCLVRSDQALGEFFAYLDRTLGPEGWAAVLSADHGVAPCPEYSASQGMDAARVDFGALRHAAVEALSSLTDNDEDAARAMIAGWGPYVFLRHHAVEQQGLSLAQVQRRLAEVLGAREEILAAYAAVDLVAGNYPRGDLLAESAAATVHPILGPDVVLILRPYSIPGGGTSGTTHGSPHDYDARVPVLLRFPSLSVGGSASHDDRPRVVLQRVRVSQVAPTVALLLGIPLPGHDGPLPFAD